jgi:hypothetical protein
VAREQRSLDRSLSVCVVFYQQPPAPASSEQQVLTDCSCLCGLRRHVHSLSLHMDHDLLAACTCMSCSCM